MTEGFQCYRCGKMYDTMWGDICNSCRDADQKHKQLVKALAEPSEKRIEQLKAERDLEREIAGVLREALKHYATVELCDLIDCGLTGVADAALKREAEMRGNE